MSMNITLHLSGIGHRRFCGADAAEQAERWSHDARCRAIDEDAEELAAIKRQQAISTPTARSLLGHLKRLGRPADTLELAEALRISRACAARILKTAAELGEVQDHGQDNRHAPKMWEAV